MNNLYLWNQQVEIYISEFFKLFGQPFKQEILHLRKFPRIFEHFRNLTKHIFL